MGIIWKFSPAKSPKGKASSEDVHFIQTKGTALPGEGREDDLLTSQFYSVLGVSDGIVSLPLGLSVSRRTLSKALRKAGPTICSPTDDLHPAI